MQKKIRSTTRWKKTASVYLLMIPALIYLLINNYLPMFGIIMAFKQVNLTDGLIKSPWNGLQNFSFLFASGDALAITRNTILYNSVFIILGLLLGVSVAIMLNEITSKFASRLYQTLILLPYLMSWVVVSYLLDAVINLRTGFAINSILPLFGIKQTIDLYQIPSVWPYILIFANIWKSTGFNVILYYAGIVGISDDYYEAARIDGASKWQQIKSITLPCLKPTVITLLILSISKIFYSDFGLFYQLPKNSGILYSTTQTIDTYVYNALMTRNDLGMSAAAGFYQSIVGFVLIIIANWIIRKLDKESALI